MDTQKSNHGGSRLGAGRHLQAFHISKEAAQELYNVMKHKQQVLGSSMTEVQIIEELIHAAWHEIDQVYQEYSTLE